MGQILTGQRGVISGSDRAGRCQGRWEDKEQRREATELENAEEGGRMRSDVVENWSWKTLTTTGR
jgi:hypothetical protein